MQDNLQPAGPAVAPTAYKHGLEDADILHAFRNAIRSEQIGDEGFVMLVGPDFAGNLLEVGLVETDEGPLIVHAMAARPKYLVW